MFQEYKKCAVVQVDSLDVGFTIKVGEISIEPKKDSRFNRAKEKRDFERRVDEEWEL